MKKCIGKIELTERAENVLSLIMILNILIIMPAEILTGSAIFTILAIIKTIIFIVIIEKTNIFEN